MMSRLLSISKIFLSFSAILFSANLAIANEKNPEANNLKNKGSIEGGASIATGNTERENSRIEVKLDSTYGKFENKLEGKASNTKDNNSRTEEYYKIANQLRYNFHPKAYGFGEFEFVSDRFSGFNSRISELLGLGYYFINEEELKISLESGIGARQTDFTGLKKDENTFLGKAEANVFWKINEHVEFNQRLALSSGADNTVTESETSLKAFFTETLYFKVGYEIENNSTVPVGNKKTDTLTTFTIGYNF